VEREALALEARQTVPLRDVRQDGRHMG
jgi:hypothetical protein